MVNNNHKAKTILNEMISTNTTTADNQAEAGGCGAIGAIMSAMKAHMNNAGVCENGCGALWNITFNGKHQPQRKGNLERNDFHKPNNS